ncbi:MAG: hypothetical protein V4549_03640 [Bacteroidota bacterium]
MIKSYCNVVQRKVRLNGFNYFYYFMTTLHALENLHKAGKKLKKEFLKLFFKPVPKKRIHKCRHVIEPKYEEYVYFIEFTRAFILEKVVRNAHYNFLVVSKNEEEAKTQVRDFIHKNFGQMEKNENRYMDIGIKMPYFKEYFDAMKKNLITYLNKYESTDNPKN